MSQTIAEIKLFFKNWMERIAKWPWQTIRWSIALSIAIPAPLAIFFIWREFWNQHAGFMLLNSILIIVLFFLHFHHKFWRENRWIVMPAVLIILIWVNSTWAQNHLATSALKTSLVSYQTAKLQVIFPERITYQPEIPASLSIKQLCRSGCAAESIQIGSKDPSMQFAFPADTPDWAYALEITLPPNEAEKVILLKRPIGSKNRSIDITIEGDVVGSLTLEGAQEARLRSILIDLLKTSNIVITIIVAVFAGLKQLDEQKRNELKNEADELIEKTREFQYQNGGLQRFLTKSLEKLENWQDWEQKQRENYIKEFQTWIETVLKNHWKEEISNDSKNNLLDVAKKIWQKIEPQEPNSTLTKVEQESSSYQPELWSCYYPPEKYPLRALFVKQGLLDFQSAPPWGLKTWNMRFAPFGDTDTPFQYIDERTTEPDFPMLNGLIFPFAAGRFSHQSYYFQTSWDVRAALYQFCQEFNSQINENSLDTARRTFFVPVLPEHWQDEIEIEAYLLRTLADVWMNVLAKVPHVVEKNSPAEQKMLAQLLTWRHGSAQAVKRILLRAQRCLDPIPPISQEFMHRLNTSLSHEKPFQTHNLPDWLALRPYETEQTMYLCAEISPAGERNVGQGQCLRSFSSALADAIQPAGVYVVRFMLANRKEQPQTLRLDKDDISKWLNLRIKLSNSGTLKALEELFPFADKKMFMNFISRANGSPGTIIQMTHNLLKRHIEQSPDKPDIPSEALLE